MNDRYFDEVVRVKLEAMQDVSAVDETALEEVLDLADQLSPSQSWWSQLSNSSSWNMWWFGAISGILVAGICWWALNGEMSSESEPPVDTEEVVLSPLKLEAPELPEEVMETEAPQSVPSIPLITSQDQHEKLTAGVDSLTQDREAGTRKRVLLPKIKRLDKIPDLSIADIRETAPAPVIVRLSRLSKKKTNSEPPTYHSPSHPNKKRTSTTRPPKYILKRR